MDSLDKLDINNDAQLVSLDTTDSESRRGTAIGQYYGNKESLRWFFGRELLYCY